MRFPKISPALMITATALMAAVIMGQARAESLRYNLIFAGGSPNPTAGSFTWDTTTKRFTSFKVEWNGVEIDLLRSANGPVTQSHPRDPNRHVFTRQDLYVALTKGWTLPNGRVLERLWAVSPPNPPGNVFTSSFALHLFADNEGIVTGGRHPDPDYVAKRGRGTFRVIALAPSDRIPEPEAGGKTNDEPPLPETLRPSPQPLVE